MIIDRSKFALDVYNWDYLCVNDFGVDYMYWYVDDKVMPIKWLVNQLK